MAFARDIAPYDLLGKELPVDPFLLQKKARNTHFMTVLNRVLETEKNATYAAMLERDEWRVTLGFASRTNAFIGNSFVVIAGIKDLWIKAPTYGFLFDVEHEILQNHPVDAGTRTKLMVGAAGEYLEFFADCVNNYMQQARFDMKLQGESA